MASKPPFRVVAPNGENTVRRRLRILVADDDRDTAMLLAVLLRDEGDEVHTVLRGDEVLDLVRLTRPDALILDINMPGMSGYAIARELRERYAQVAPLMIAISGVWTKTSERLVARSVGFDHYLAKPYEPDELLRLLEPLRVGGTGATGAA